MCSVSFAQGAMRLVGEAFKGFRLVRAVAFGLEGLRFYWRGWSRHRALGLGEVQNDKKPEECEQDELIDNPTATLT